MSLETASLRRLQDERSDFSPSIFPGELALEEDRRRSIEEGGTQPCWVE
jgi:hypothetical protein